MADIDSNLPVKDLADGSDGAAAPSVTLQIGGVDDSGNLQTISVKSSGELNTNNLNRLSSSTALAALNATITLDLEGKNSIGFQLSAGTLAATIVPEQSLDNGTSWVAASYFNPVTQVISSSLTVTNPNSLTALGIITMQGATQARVRVSSYTSGTANGQLSAAASAGFQASIPADRADTDSNTAFSWATKSFNLASAGTDNPLVLIKNPSTSGKNVYIKSITCGITVTNVSAVFLVYGSPTVTANGTAVTPMSRSIGSGVSSTTQVYTGPTISSNGNVISSFNNAQNSNSLAIIDAYQLKIPPGGTILLTGDPSSNNRAAAITIVWTEV